MSERDLEVFDVASLRPPTPLGSTELIITAENVERYRQAFPLDVLGFSDWPLILFDQETVRLIARRWSHGRTVQTRARWLLTRRVEAGERVITRAGLTGTTVKNGLERVASDAFSMVGDEVVGLVTMEHATPVAASQEPPNSQVRSRHQPTPDEAPEWLYAWSPTSTQLLAYSGTMHPPDNIHTDLELAREAGHRSLVVQGHHTFALMLELLVRRIQYVGPVDARARFTRSWYVHDTAVIAARRVENDHNSWSLLAKVDDVPVVIVDVTLGSGAERAAGELGTHESAPSG